MDEDGVPAPIPIRRERLIEPPNSHRPNTRPIRAAFSDFSNSHRYSSQERRKAEGLEALYATPEEILFRGSFEELKIYAQQEQKWILVNIIDRQDFGCLSMNRDTW